jgi:hypothetical protein
LHIPKDCFGKKKKKNLIIFFKNLFENFLTYSSKIFSKLKIIIKKNSSFILLKNLLKKNPSRIFLIFFRNKKVKIISQGYF